MTTSAWYPSGTCSSSVTDGAIAVNRAKSSWCPPPFASAPGASHVAAPAAAKPWISRRRVSRGSDTNGTSCISSPPLSSRHSSELLTPRPLRDGRQRAEECEGEGRCGQDVDRPWAHHVEQRILGRLATQVHVIAAGGQRGEPGAHGERRRDRVDARDRTGPRHPSLAEHEQARRRDRARVGREV